ncbi:MXAN_6230/SCO0854 family RING domain-containing protein [Actinoplanes derwentensis]|uniref:RING finger family protein 4 n=1 Tax=Actinoplanes derwentensis TaxID=113562 RepID=A0A1H1WTF4_9ACTN|nr:MXAN_6230/SCO0854 family RING domain-containing protein [Actinoplanes derwentensis]GID86977.1 hypothetical protein Ade03nite_59010 [Actinoplanes derwentensis]SDT00463.1 RING finger family protein 4 [Actinoplanes derwentensis]
MDQLATVVLRRTGRVTVIGGGQVPADGAGWLTALEADLAGRGWVMDVPLRRAATRLPVTVRVQWADWLLAVLDEETGADRPLVPLYRSFPDTPRDPGAVFVRRLLTHLLAAPDAPCVLCGRDEIGSPLDPCGHLVCPACFPPSQVSGCPVCGRRLTAGSSYLTPVAPPPTVAREKPQFVAEIPPVRVAGLETDPFTAAVQLRDQLVARPGALAESDRSDLRALVAVTAPGRLDWLPETVPSRETQALLVAWALRESPAAVDAARARWETVTDVARTLWAYSDGDPGLLVAGSPRVRPVPRPLRRAVLAHLQSRGAVNAAEDMLRHGTVWKRLGERLHPYEKVTSHPAAAVAFAALRGTRAARSGDLGRAILAHAGDQLELSSYPDGTVAVRLRSHASLVERALAGGDVPAAARLLTQRPGDLWRRLDHLLRSAGDSPSALSAVTAAVRTTATRVAPGVLSAAAAQLNHRDATVRASPADVAVLRRSRVDALAARRARAHARDAVPLVTAFGSVLGSALGSAVDYPGSAPAPAPSVDSSSAGSAAREDGSPGAATLVGGRPGPAMPRRIFFPKGSTVTTWTEPENRAALPATVIETVRSTVDGELVRRASGLLRFDLAVLDARLAEVPAPVRERAGSAQLAGWPRGSMRELPTAGVLRLFLHWEEPEKIRVDLDLSCAFFGAEWQRAGWCDYTNLRFAGDAAIHSGDLTSAPAPLGATEYLDLDVDRLVAAGARYAVPMIFSFNAVPFETLPAAIAGLMLPLRGGEQFDAARVAQRFDLQGVAQMMMPFVVDLERRRLLWTDLTLPGTAEYYDVGQFGDQLARAAADQQEHFLGGHRTTVLDVLAWHAAARADRIVIVHADGTRTEVPASPAAIRAAAALPSGEPAASIAPGTTMLAGAVDATGLDGLTPGPGSVALTVTGHPGSRWTALSTIDLFGELPPAVTG